MQRCIVIFAFHLSIVGSCGHSGNRTAVQLQGKPQRGPVFWIHGHGRAPRLLWKYEGLGKGFGRPLVTMDGICINAEEDGNSHTVCLDHKGTLRWGSPNGKEFTGIDFSAGYPGTRSTPSAMGRHVYAASGTGHLSCFDSRTGKVVWTVDLIRDLDGKLGDFGYSESPQWMRQGYIVSQAERQIIL